MYRLINGNNYIFLQPSNSNRPLRGEYLRVGLMVAIVIFELFGIYLVRVVSKL